MFIDETAFFNKYLLSPQYFSSSDNLLSLITSLTDNYFSDNSIFISLSNCLTSVLFFSSETLSSILSVSSLWYSLQSQWWGWSLLID